MLSKFHHLAFLVFALLVSNSAFAAKRVTIELLDSPLINARIERILNEYGYKVILKQTPTKWLASNPNADEISNDLVIDLSYHNTFFGIKESNTPNTSKTVSFYLHNPITHEEYLNILDQARDLGIQVIKAKTQKKANFILVVPPNKLGDLIAAYRQYPSLDRYVVFDKTSATQFLRDNQRTGVTTVNVYLKSPDVLNSVLAAIPTEIPTVVNYQSAAAREAAKLATSEGGVAEIMLPAEYGMVATLISSIEPFRSDEQIKIFPDDEYYRANGDNAVAYVVQTNNRRYLIKPQFERVMKAATRQPGINEYIHEAMKTRNISADEARYEVGSEVLRKEILEYKGLDIYALTRLREVTNQVTYHTYVEIPENSLDAEMLNRLLVDFQLFPLKDDGYPDIKQEVLRVGHKNCDSLLKK